jgi:hypothetical protein
MDKFRTKRALLRAREFGRPGTTVKNTIAEILSIVICATIVVPLACGRGVPPKTQATGRAGTKSADVDHRKTDTLPGWSVRRTTLGGCEFSLTELRRTKQGKFALMRVGALNEPSTESRDTTIDAPAGFSYVTAKVVIAASPETRKALGVILGRLKSFTLVDSSGAEYKTGSWSSQQDSSGAEFSMSFDEIPDYAVLTQFRAGEAVIDLEK